MINKSKKKTILSSYKEVIEESKALYFVTIEGVGSREVTNLRKKLKKYGSNFYMVKNSIMKIALEEANVTDIIGDMVGQYGLINATEDVVEPAKLIKEFAKENANVEPAFGVLDNERIAKEQIVQLADLPSKDQLRGMVAGTMIGVIRNTMGVLNGAVRDFTQLLSAREDALNKS